jgi:hypothetical protein
MFLSGKKLRDNAYHINISIEAVSFETVASKDFDAIIFSKF